ncbi:MAG: hypothetical protein LBW85_07635 [Deltaproteobacteria bacterium]|jgi:transposase|nr:hypothetical protein [Deltaproteobacteria bacterium]
MYIDVVPNRSGKPAVLLRESKREGNKIIKTTVANLSGLDPNIIRNIRIALKGGDPSALSNEKAVEEIVCDDIVPWGHVKAVMTAMDSLGIGNLLDPQPSRERDMALGLVAARILRPLSRYCAAARRNACPLAAESGLEGFDGNDACRALDWLLERQPAVQRRLAGRHLSGGGLAFLDMSSSCHEGGKPPLVSRRVSDSDSDSDSGSGSDYDAGGSSLLRHGSSRDRIRGRLRISYALLTDKEGRPISIEAFPGNTAGSADFLPAADRIRNEFSLKRIVMVGGWGMIGNDDIPILKAAEGIDWITALRPTSVKSLAEREVFSFRKSDGYDFREFSSPEYPDERLVACKYTGLKEKREKTRDFLIDAAAERLGKINARALAGMLKNKDAIALAAGRVVENCKAGKHFILEFSDQGVSYRLNDKSIGLEKALDGICAIRTSLPAETMTIEECVLRHNDLSQAEGAFRTVKSLDLPISPACRRLDDGIRASLFLTMLAYYVEWHLRDAWRELTFGDPETSEINNERGPAAPAPRSQKAERKISAKQAQIGDSIFRARKHELILAELAAVNEVSLVFRGGGKNNEDLVFKRYNKYSQLQSKAFKLLKKIPKYQ